ncbi:MAG: AAA family ATPase [Burkholderiaceae bacterium]
MSAYTGSPVQRIDTHISTILLSGDEAWKLKRPVRLPFVDFGSVEARRRCCEAELGLNRRLAPTLYLDVLAVRGPEASPSIEGLPARSPDTAPADARAGRAEQAAGGAPVIEYLVRMRRFPPGALFSERVAAGTLTVDDVTRLAHRLAEFDRSAAVQHDPTIADAVAREAAKVIGQLRALAADRGTDAQRGAIAGLAAWLDVHGQRLAPVFRTRLRTGRVRDVHGDLHLANAVVLDDEVTAFDCLEFDDGLRRIDVIGDAAFLAMDLHAHGCPALAHRLVDAWCEAADDHAAMAVLPFHQVYRACVRALVAWLAPAPSIDDVDRYLRTAERLSDSDRRPTLTITHGPSGSGKSRAAARLVELDGGLRLRSDVERKRLAGLSPLADSRAAGLDLYTREWTNRTYARLESLADATLTAGAPVVVDAAFLRRPERQRFAALARWHGVPFRIVDCRADPATLRARVIRRASLGGDPSEADTSVIDRQLVSADPLDAHELAARYELPEREDEGGGRHGGDAIRARAEGDTTGVDDEDEDER